MERLIDVVRGYPPVTRSWCFAIMGCATLTTFKWVSKVVLLFHAERAFTNQWWRLVTGFCFFDEWLLNLLVRIIMISFQCRRLEEMFETKRSLLPDVVRSFTPRQTATLQTFIDRNKSLDYLYFFLQICFTLVAGVTLCYYWYDLKTAPFMGNLLSEILLYYSCRSRPHAQMNFLVFFNVRSVYIPFVNILVGWLILGKPLDRIFEILEGKLSPIQTLFWWESALTLSISHIFWFSRETLLSAVYYENDEKKTNARDATLAAHGIKKYNVVQKLLIVVFLPPWYWVIIPKIKNNVH